MAITDNKVTATPTTVGVGSAGDLLIGSTPAELAANKAIFDAYADAIKGNHDDLIDYIDLKPLYFESAVAAATANKGSFSGWVPQGAIVDLVMTNGNTSAAPTIVIDSVTYNITGLPTVAKISTATAQAYKLKKTAGTTLVFITLPDYICESGTVVAGQHTCIYERYASGVANTNSAVSKGSNFTFSASGNLYKSDDLTVTFPSGLFNAEPKCLGITVATASALAVGLRRAITYSDPLTTMGVAVGKTDNTAADYGIGILLKGTWR